MAVSSNLTKTLVLTTFLFILINDWINCKNENVNSQVVQFDTPFGLSHLLFLLIINESYYKHLLHKKYYCVFHPFNRSKNILRKRCIKFDGYILSQWQRSLEV